MKYQCCQNRIALGCSEHFSGSVADFDNLQRMVSWHENELKEAAGKNQWQKTEPLVDNYPPACGLIVEKEYHWFAEFLRERSPFKICPGDTSLLVKKYLIERY